MIQKCGCMGGSKDTACIPDPFVDSIESIIIITLG